MMTGRSVESVALRLLLSTLFLQVSAVSASAQGPAGTVAEPPEPKPSAAVEKILTEANCLAEAKQSADSLKAAEQAVEAARQANDKPGEAFGQQARAKALDDLTRKDEAMAAWQEAAQLWAAAEGDSPEEITALVQAGLHCLPDKKSAADDLLAQGLSAAKSGNRRPDAVVQSLYNAGVLIGDRGQQQASRDYLRAVLTVSERPESESLKFIETLNALSKMALTRAINNNDDAHGELARDYAARAAELGQRLAPNSAIVVKSLHLEAYCEDLLSNGAGGNAPEHYLAALEMQKKVVPTGSIEEAEILRDLGNLEESQAKFELAKQHLEEAVAIGERVAPESAEFEHSLENLGNEEGQEGDLSAAREHLQRALAIKKKLNANLAPTFINLGALALYESDYAAAREYFEKALALFLKVPHRTLGVPAALSDLSWLFDEQGDLASALEYRRRALVVEETDFPDSLNLANDLNAMGDLLRRQGKFSEANDYYQRALELRQKKAPDSLVVSDTLESLAQLARDQHNPGLAMKYEASALELAQKSCPSLLCTPRFLNVLGELAYEQGDLASSENYLRQAVDLREKNLGSSHPDLARSLNDLALTVAAQGKTTEALANALRAERIGSAHLRESVRTLSERQALAYESVRASGLDLALSLAAERTITPSARSEVFDAVIRSRALVFDELAARQRSASESGDPEVKQLSDQLLSARTRLATLVFRGAEDMKPEAYRKLLDDAREQKEKAERMLAEKSLAFRRDQARSLLGLKEVSAALPQGAALLAYVRYAQHDLQPPAAGKAVPQPVASYLAFVLLAGEPEPELVRLGSARDMDRLLKVWLGTITRQAEAPDESGVPVGDAYQRAGIALRRKIWDPLVPRLGDTRRAFIVPDGAMHLVSFASLPVGRTQYLIETGPLIHYLSTERDLVPAETRHGEGILVVSNPAFDRAGEILVASSQGSTGTAPAILRGDRSACGTFQSLHFPPLPGSQQEAESVATLWREAGGRSDSSRLRGATIVPSIGDLVQVTGVDASPDAFVHDAPGKRVLHVATHGFFLEGSCESAVQRRLGADTRNETSVPTTAENPLLLSGLAFAGANRRAAAKPEESDGILTAEEIAGINLEGVDWAVLSACDTGLGEIKVGEGVFGLRRAFQVAGAKTVIMSLWPIEDQTTKEWMGTLYREHFRHGKDTSQSMRAASLRILKQRREKGRSTSPFYWAAFIAAGDWH
jgi:tetratricopeptide (TPR) repeat protein